MATRQIQGYCHGPKPLSPSKLGLLVSMAPSTELQLSSPKLLMALTYATCK